MGASLALSHALRISLVVATALLNDESDADSRTHSHHLNCSYTPACCSDHQSFVSNSYASTWIFERNGAIADPFVPLHLSPSPSFLPLPSFPAF